MGIDMPSDNACNKYQPMFPYSKRAVSKYCLLGCRLSCQLVRSWKVLILLLQIPPNSTRNAWKRSPNASQKTPWDPHLEQLSPKQEHRMSFMGFGKHLGGQWRHIRLPRSGEIVKRSSRGRSWGPSKKNIEKTSIFWPSGTLQIVLRLQRELDSHMRAGTPKSHQK